MYNTVSPVHNIFHYMSLEAGGEMGWGWSHVQHSKSCSYYLSLHVIGSRGGWGGGGGGGRGATRSPFHTIYNYKSLEAEWGAGGVAPPPPPFLLVIINSMNRTYCVVHVY